MNAVYWRVAAVFFFCALQPVNTGNNAITTAKIATYMFVFRLFIIYK
jgi:hypothetical protein